MAKYFIVGSKDCSTQRIASIINHSSDFHLFYQKWSSFATDLQINKAEIEKLSLALLWKQKQLSDVVRDVVEIWIGQTGSKATLDKLISALRFNNLDSIAELLKFEFEFKNYDWDIPSYYINRTIISRNVINKKKFLEEVNYSKDIFVFVGIAISKLNNVLENQMVENSTRMIDQKDIKHNVIVLDYFTHFNKICSKANCPVHLIRADDDKWIHVKSNGNLLAIRNIIDNIQACLTEEEFNQFNESEIYPVCISDSPGMGKSTLLQSIGQHLSKTDKKVLFAAMNEFVSTYRRNSENNGTKAALELTLQKLFCSNICQERFLSSKLHSEDLQIELLLDGLDEVTSSNKQFALDMLNQVSKISSIRLWVTTRPHLLNELESSLNVIGFNMEAFTKQNQINFLKHFWLLHSTNLVTDRLEQFADFCLSELNSKLNRKDRDIAGIPLQCLLIGQVYSEQATEHCAKKDPNTAWIIKVNTLIELYQSLVEKQYEKYRKNFSDKFITKEQANLQHVRLALQLIFPDVLDKIPIPSIRSVVLQELLNVGLLEKSSTVLKPKFIHRTVGEFFIANFIVETLQTKSKISKCVNHLLEKVFECDQTKLKIKLKRFGSKQSATTYYFLNNEICHFLDTLLAQEKTTSFFDIRLDTEQIAYACMFGDYYNLFKTFHLISQVDQQLNEIFNKDFLLVAAGYSSLPFLELLIDQNPNVFQNSNWRMEAFRMSIRNGKLQIFQYLLNIKNLRVVVTRPNYFTRFLIHECAQDSLFDSSSIVKQKLYILRMLLDLNSDLLEVQDENEKTPILCPSVHPELLTEFITRNVNISVKDKNKNTILHVHGEHLLALFSMLTAKDQKSLIHVNNAQRETPLMTLITNLDPAAEILIKFKELGADFNIEDNQGYSLLARSIVNKRTPETISWLIKLGANVHWKKGWKRKSLVHYAGQFGNVDAMLLLSSQFQLNINQKDLSLKTPIEYLLDFCLQNIEMLNNTQTSKVIKLAKSINFNLPPEITKGVGTSH